ncbi:TetR/AcrR family transcriptional regulator [Auraticoccus monumenti]|nr:TetR/AcrR family transcriptional regulator [Auraticoccus monumenti]
MLRTDAQDNRERVLAAARALFAERGVDVTMRDVARRAEVGPATLYRRFPTKQALLSEAFEEEVRFCSSIVDDGCTDPDPWRGFCSVVERICTLNIGNQGFVDAFVSGSPGIDALAEHRAALLRRLAELAGRAQAVGGLRGDFVVDDLVLVLLAGRGLASVPPAQREATARRFAALVIEAFRASDDDVTLPRPPRLITRPVRAPR